MRWGACCCREQLGAASQRGPGQDQKCPEQTGGVTTLPPPPPAAFRASQVGILRLALAEDSVQSADTNELS